MEPTLVWVCLALWLGSVAAFVLGFAVNLGGSEAALGWTLFIGLALAALLSVASFLAGLASAISYPPHRPWNVVVLLLTLALSPAALLLVLLSFATL